MLTRICESRKLAALSSDGARLLYTWLIPNVDIKGRFSGDPLIVNSRIFTRLGKSINTVEKYLEDLTEVGLIIRYSANDDIYLQIPDFEDKQPSLRTDRESPSVIPDPPDDVQTPQKSYFKKATIPIDLVRKVSERDKNVCQMCGKVGIEDAHFKHYVVENERDGGGRKIAFEIDHIIPEYLGGETTLDNLRLVCRKCNRQKGFQATPAQLQQNSGADPLKVKVKVKVKIKEKETYSTEFISFWTAYPLKKGKLAAWRSWERLNPPLKETLDVIERYKRSEDWKKEGGRFIPHPATFLNGGRWEDEPGEREMTTAEVIARYDADEAKRAQIRLESRQNEHNRS